jgi:hypothetical protein
VCSAARTMHWWVNGHSCFSGCCSVESRPATLPFGFQVLFFSRFEKEVPKIPSRQSSTPTVSCTRTTGQHCPPIFKTTSHCTPEPCLIDSDKNLQLTHHHDSYAAVSYTTLARRLDITRAIPTAPRPAPTTLPIIPRTAGARLVLLPTKIR